MFHVLHLCPNLVKFNWINDFEEPDIDENNCRFDHSRLRYLNVSALGFNIRYSEFIAKKLTELMRLDFTVGRPVDRPSRDAFDIDQFHKWQSNFSGIEKFYCIVYNILRFSITNYWLFIDGINSNGPSTSVHITTVVAPQNTRRNNEVKLYKHEKRTFFYCEIDIEELNSWRNDVSSISLQSPLIPPNLDSKSMIQTYEVHWKLCNHNEEQLLHELFPSMLPLALKSFPNIHYFNVVAYPMYKQWKTRKYQIAVVSSEIDYYKVCANDSFSPTMSTPHCISDPSKRLAYVKLNSIHSPDELRMIFNLLPNTQYLNLIDGIKDLDRNYNVMLNLDNLHLNLFHLDLTTLALKYPGEHTIVLQIDETDIDRKHFFKWKRENRGFREMTFEPTSEDFLQKYGRFTSKQCNIVIIKVKRVEQMLVSSKPNYLRIPVMTTHLNFTLQSS